MAVVAGLALAAILGGFALLWRKAVMPVSRRLKLPRRAPPPARAAEQTTYERHRLDGEQRDELRRRIRALERASDDCNVDDMTLIQDSAWFLHIYGGYADGVREAAKIPGRTERVDAALRAMRAVLVDETPAGFDASLTDVELLELWLDVAGIRGEKRDAARERTREYLHGRD